MRSRPSILFFLASVFAAVAAGASLPSLEPFVIVRDGVANLDVGSYAAPDAADWNNDGKIDLVAGHYTGGQVLLYLNQGTTGASPVFNGSSNIESGGVAIQTGYADSMGSAPRVVDWNSDGKKDLILGERYGVVHLLLNQGTDDSPVFTSSSPYTLVQVGDVTFDAGDYSMPVFVDWNNDGKRDLLCGEFYGHVYLALNTGTAAAPAFSSSSLLQDGLGDLDVGDRAAPFVWDWDGDGKKDLLCGSYFGNVYFFENKGTDSAPVFSGWEIVQASATNLDVGSDARPTVADWDGDGTADLLVGDSEGRVFFFRATPPPPPLSVGGEWMLFE